MTPLHQKATPNPEYLVPPPPVLADPRAVFDRLMGVASLLRALDSTLPEHVRFYRRAELAEDNRNNTSFKLAFVADPTSRGMATERDVDFWDAAERLLPAHALAGERKNLEAAPSYKFASPVDAAVYGAHLEHALSMVSNPVDDEWMVQSSNALRVPSLDFMSEPSLSRWLYLAPYSTVDEDVRISPARTLARAHVRTLMGVLSKSYEDASAAERQAVKAGIDALETIPLEKGRPSFEATHQHGWIGYALAHGAKGWTKPLLNMGANGRVPYNGELPVVWATALDAASDLNDLVAADASVSLILPAAPKVYDPVNQARLDERMGDFTSLVGFAAAVGASRAAAALCKLGANIHHADTAGATPLHRAAADGNEKLCRVLVLHGADLSKEDLDEKIPAERVPFENEGLFRWMEAARLGKPEAQVELDTRPEPVDEGFGWASIETEKPGRPRRSSPKA